MMQLHLIAVDVKSSAIDTTTWLVISIAAIGFLILSIFIARGAASKRTEARMRGE
jgi:hypothetical protein